MLTISYYSFSTLFLIINTSLLIIQDMQGLYRLHPPFLSVRWYFYYLHWSLHVCIMSIQQTYYRDNFITQCFLFSDTRLILYYIISIFCLSVAMYGPCPFNRCFQYSTIKRLHISRNSPRKQLFIVLLTLFVKSFK
jgi:hypothetical protein